MLLDRIVRFISSLRLTVVCLILAIILVFFGTLAQVNEGLYNAQARWFRSFFVWWTPGGTDWRFPFLPGGYLVGTVLLVNLIAAHFQRFALKWSKLGIHVTHAGLILLLVGQLSTDMFSRETLMSFNEGETANYTVSPSITELVFITPAANGKGDDVISIPQSLLTHPGKVIHNAKLPFDIRVQAFYVNAAVRQRAPMMDTNPPPATAGFGPDLTLFPQPEVKTTDERNTPAVILELSNAKGSLGTWLAYAGLSEQEITVDNRTWRMALRFERHYLPFSMKLLKTKHEVYRGTDIPRNFQSRVQIDNPVTHESRAVDIYMNNPLRYGGLTFYQYQMGRDQVDERRGNSVLQVVRNPGWLTPYIGCGLVGGGLLIQFLMHLVKFIKRRRTV